MTADSTYIVANYTSSSAVYFPDNKPQHFSVKLSKALEFKSSVWKVALCEIFLQDILPIHGKEDTYPSLFSIHFGQCSGLTINGNSTNSLRVIPNASDAHIIFPEPFYLPLEAEYIDTFEIILKNLQGVPLKLHLADSTLITVTLHFKKY